MFSRRTRGRRGSGEPFTYIQEGTVLRGDLEAAGRVRIHGTVLGNVTVAGVLEVAAEGMVKGDRVEADQVRILGAVEAMVCAAGKVEIWRGGQLTGDVRAASLDIEEGASFTGRSEMRPPGSPPALPDGSARAGQVNASPSDAETEAESGAETGAESGAESGPKTVARTGAGARAADEEDPASETPLTASVEPRT
ncbi:MAG: polymer-forming cytoskeletal protein [Trueperaceae bacterium]